MGFWDKAFDIGKKAVVHLNEEAIKKQQQIDRSVERASTRTDKQLVQDIKDNSFLGPSTMDKYAAKKELMDRHPEKFRKKDN
jgi:hypothetical protein